MTNSIRVIMVVCSQSSTTLNPYYKQVVIRQLFLIMHMYIFIFTILSFLCHFVTDFEQLIPQDKAGWLWFHKNNLCIWIRQFRCLASYGCNYYHQTQVHSVTWLSWIMYSDYIVIRSSEMLQSDQHQNALLNADSPRLPDEVLTWFFNAFLRHCVQ